MADPKQERRLTRIPYTLTVEWRCRIVTTRPPVYVPHEEWDLFVTVRTTAPLRLAGILRYPGGFEWHLHDDLVTDSGEQRLYIRPHDWEGSEDMWVSWFFGQTCFPDEALKHDPRGAVKVLVPPRAMTSDLVPVAELPNQKLSFELIAFAVEDTQKRRMDRWRVRPALVHALSPDLVPLTSGRRWGDSNHPPTG